MHQERTVQATIFEVFAGHEIGCELKAISQWLDQQRALVSLVAGDLRRHGLRETGRCGLPAETVLRCALLKQQRQLSYEELAFHLEDSASFRAFARLPLAWSHIYDHPLLDRFQPFFPLVFALDLSLLE
jgi:IS5 family transposase